MNRLFYLQEHSRETHSVAPRPSLSWVAFKIVKCYLGDGGLDQGQRGSGNTGDAAYSNIYRGIVRMEEE